MPLGHRKFTLLGMVSASPLPGDVILPIVEVEDSVLEHVGHVIFHSESDMFGLVEPF